MIHCIHHQAEWPISSEIVRLVYIVLICRYSEICHSRATYNARGSNGFDDEVF